MNTTDSVCTLVPYFQVADGRLDQFKALCERFVERTAGESGCLFYGFSFNGDIAHCREGYDSAEAVLAHLQNVAELLDQALNMADIIRLEVHGPSDAIEKLRAPLAALSPDFFVLEYGFRRELAQA